MCAEIDSCLVLVVDDDRGLSMLARRRLEEEGFRVASVDTGHGAIDWLQTNHADLMLLDLVLPDMTGQEVLQALTARGTSVPFVVMTGYGDERVAVEVMKQGAIDYLSKDSALPELLPSVVHHAIERLGQQARLTETEAALREKQESERRFKERLTALLQVNNQLMEVSSFEGLCQRAVELGRERLGFDRLGIWFTTSDGRQIDGSFGTDEHGNIRDERGHRMPLDDHQRDMLAAPNPVPVVHRAAHELRNDHGQAVGTGELAWTSIWDGQKNIGFLIADNLLQHHPITDADDELLALFASSLGHLCLLKRTEEQIRRLNEELEGRVQARTAELTAVNRELEAFCYSVSHDLRAPLRAIDGFSRALAEDYSEHLEEGARSYLQRVQAASQRMVQLIDDLLQLSRMTRAEMRLERVDLSAIARAVAQDLEYRHPDRKVDVTIQDNLLVRGDAQLLRILVENLFSNAWKFTGQKSPAKIEFGQVPIDGMPVFFIRDNGAGFDMTYAGKLFGAFQRLHAASEFPGTGVGLATVQRIVHRHGGHIWAEGRVGEGAVFYFRLPLVE